MPYLLKFSKALINIFYLNFFFLLSKIIGKKTILICHTEFITDNINYFFLKQIKKYDYDTKLSIIYCNVNFLNKNSQEFYIPLSFIKLIYLCDFFLTNYICHLFPKNAKKIYLHHAIYDTPLSKFENYRNLKKRLLNYNYIFLCSEKSLPAFDQILKKKLLIYRFIGYYKYKYIKKNLKKKIKKNDKYNNILIAPTGFSSVPSLSINLIIFELIKLLLNNKYNVTLRPHPRDKNSSLIKKIITKNKNNLNFKINFNNDYISSFRKCDFLITDTSDIAYSFNLLTFKPVIFYSKNVKYLKKNNSLKYNYFNDRKKIGSLFSKKNQILKKINYLASISKKNKKNTIKITKKMNFNLNTYKEIVNFFYTN